MKTISTFNALHLGDNLVHLHFLRALAKRYPEINFRHGAPEQHLGQLHPVVADLPNIELRNLDITSCGAINAWCGAGGWWYQQPTTNDWCHTFIRWLDHLAKLMGLENPILEPRDMLFDYPALKAEDRGQRPDVRSQKSEVSEYDFLIVNSQPMSGQWAGFNDHAFSKLCAFLSYHGTVITTYPTGVPMVDHTPRRNLCVTGIGKLSQRARCIIGCVTGPMWPTLNVWNSEADLSPVSGLRSPVFRVHLQDREHVNMAPNTVHANSLYLVPEILKDRGLL